MADKKMDASKIDALYSWLSYDLQKIRAELLKELKYSSVQIGSLYQEMKTDKEKSAQAIAQEIRYSYKQNQTIYDGLATMLNGAVNEKLASIEEKSAAIEELRVAIANITEVVKEAVSQEVRYGYVQNQTIYAGLEEKLALINDKLATLEPVDGDYIAEQTCVKLAESIQSLEITIDELCAKNAETEEAVLNASRQMVEAINNMPANDNVDYGRIVDEVGDKLLEVLNDVGLSEPAPVPVPSATEIDYDKVIYGTAEKVVESLPYPDKVDYRRIDESFANAAKNVTVSFNEDALASIVSVAVEKALSAVNVDAIADKVLEKLQIPTVEAPEVDYERLSDMVVAKLVAIEQKPTEISEKSVSDVAEAVVAKTVQPEIPEVDYERIATIVEEKLAAKEETEATYELVLDEEGVQSIATTVAQELCRSCAVCEEENVEEAVIEETVTEEPVAEEPQEEPIVEELAVAEEAPVAEEPKKELVNAEDGLVLRKKKSFTAKMKQSEESVKVYYSDLKNELTSYKKINSNISWHGDRFNYGRDTVAKVNICGKTLCFYIALDPENPEFKTTVYHQKNVGNQKAYESTPFMVKVKSDAAAKKALRLVGYLAEKLGTEKENDFEPVDYVTEFAYEDDDALEAAGFIKTTKEKKVDLDF